MKTRKFKVGIVGGGSIAVSFLHSLTSELKKNQGISGIEIMIFDSRNDLGEGCYWTNDVDSNILNTRADTMSAMENDKLHFLNWLKNNEAAWHPHFPTLKISSDAFLPRSLFGLYLRNIFQSSLTDLKSLNIKFSHIKDDVTDILRMMNGLCVDTGSSGAFEVNHVVLCMGNLPSTLFSHLQDIDCYHHSPYPSKNMVANIPKDEPVCVIGTSLSGIDTIVSLVESGHKGKIICTSRSGRFPSVRGELAHKTPPKPITREQIDLMAEANGGYFRLSDVEKLLVEEIERIEGSKFNLEKIINAGASAYDCLLNEIELSLTEERTWQSVAYATNNIIDYMWHRMDIEDKRKFFSVYRGLWFRHRVSFPLQNALKLKELIRTDQLSILSGFQGVEYDEHKKSFAVHLDSCNGGLKSTIFTKHVVNATCYSMDVKSSKIPLIQNLLRRKLTAANEFGGVEVDYETGMLIYPNGTQAHDFSVLGSMANGVYFWTNAFDVNVRTAARQARNLGAKIAQLKSNEDQVHQSDIVIRDAGLGSVIQPNVAKNRESEQYSSIGVAV
jgi:uncharacterized NAD(P)/FAD-binding protein YdhS